ncbi:MAG: hypothetical protein QG564_1524 [Campylobacterota bacterium]|nr:hypothetical protein [Campylobacterota bacterium]
MEQELKIEFKYSTVENIQIFCELLGKDVNTLLEEALEQYFERERKKLDENHEDENMTAGLDYDEFWSGVDL